MTETEHDSILNKLKNKALSLSHTDGLDFGEKGLIICSALIAGKEFGLLRSWLAWIIEKDAGKDEIYETILQSYLFCGYPAAIEALFCLSKVSPVNGSRNDNSGTREERKQEGAVLCRQVYGENYDQLRANIKKISPELESWMIEEGYGKVLSRPGLPGYVRELCTVAALIVTGFPRQLHSHIRGALNLGCSETKINEIFGLLDCIIESDRLSEAKELCDKITSR